MSILMWLVVGMILAGSLATIYLVGKPRDPITPGLAVSTVLINLVMVAIILGDQGLLG